MEGAMKGQARIEEVFAFIIVDDDDTEGVPAIQIGNMAYPLFGADMKRIESLLPRVKELARQSGKPIKLVKFQHRIELQVIKPEDI